MVGDGEQLGVKGRSQKPSGVGSRIGLARRPSLLAVPAYRFLPSLLIPKTQCVSSWLSPHSERDRERKTGPLSVSMVRSILGHLFYEFTFFKLLVLCILFCSMFCIVTINLYFI